MTPEPYLTVAGPGECAFVVDGSRFLGFVRPAETIAAAEATIEQVATAHPEATHVIPAYRVRENELLRAYASDEGEPSGSAGPPAREVLERRDLENVVAVVVRYYGGTNLGIGGLVRAYGRAVSAAIEDAGIVTERPHTRIVVTAAYDDSGTVRSILESGECTFEAEYEESVTFTVRVPTGDRPALLERLRSATSDRVTIEEGTIWSGDN